MGPAKLGPHHHHQEEVEEEAAVQAPVGKQAPLQTEARKGGSLRASSSPGTHLARGGGPRRAKGQRRRGRRRGRLEGQPRLRLSPGRWQVS